MNFYAYTDKALKYLRRYYIREFDTAKMRIRADTLNVISVSKELYDDISAETERVFRKIAKWKYRQICGEDFIIGMWLSGLLNNPDPLTGYVWRNDIDRKRAYFAESVLSGESLDKAAKKALLNNPDPLTGYLWQNDIDRKRAYFAESVLSGESLDKAAKKALRYWYQSQKQYADIITDAAALQAYADTKIQFVKWRTADDCKVCAVCNDRDGRIYPIDHAPRKPHYNCRCYYVKA